VHSSLVGGHRAAESAFIGDLRRGNVDGQIGRELRSHLRQRGAGAQSPSGKIAPTKGFGPLLPPLSASGHLPPGRHPASLAELHEHFVEALPASTTRPAIWEGFLGYLTAWDEAEQHAGAEVLRGVWIAGSFASSTLDPSDIDVSPIYDRDALVSLSGKPGSGRIKELFTHRARVVSTYKVEPFAVPWLPIPSTLLPDRLTPGERDVLSVRGGLDTWWGRVRPPGPRVAPVPPTTLADRGYVEVILR
jgi:hypothetical protein